MTLEEVFISENFIQFRCGNLTKDDQKYFLKRLEESSGIYGLLSFLRVVETLPIGLLKPIVDKILEYEDVSAPREYMEIISRVFTPEKVQDRFLETMVTNDNLKVKCKVAGVLYCVVGRFTTYNYPRKTTADSIPFGQKYIWDGERYIQQRVQENASLFIRRKADYYQKRIEILVQEFNKSDNIIYKYFLQLNLRNDIESYPLNLREEARGIITEINNENFPKSAETLLQAVEGKKELEFLLYDELKWGKR